LVVCAIHSGCKALDLPEGFLKIVGEIRGERVRGAAWSARKAAEAFITLAESGDPGSRGMERAASMIIEANPGMASLYNVARLAMEAYAQNGIGGVDEAARRFIEYQSETSRKIALEAQKILPRGIVVATISFSSNVYAALAYAGGKLGKAVVLESRPGGEGVFLAKELKRRRVEVELVPDSSMHVFLKDVDLVLVGADTVTWDACLYNKVGTRLLIEAAKRREIPVAGVFEAYKIHPAKKCGEVEPVATEYEVEGYGTIITPLFDHTPPALIDAMITSSGVSEYTAPALRRIYREFYAEILSSDDK